MTDNVVALHPMPDVPDFRSYKSIHALCTIVRGKGDDKPQYRATHYACVLLGGPNPIWGVWQVTGKFLRFASSRYQIEQAYPSLVWRRKMATWACTNAEDKTIEQRRAEIETLYGKRIKGT